MNHKLGVKGEVEISIRKGKKQKVKNAISSELKNVIASSMTSAQDFKLNTSKFDDDNFASPTAGENGITVHTSAPTYYQTKTTGVSANTSTNKLTVTSSTRADGASYTFTGAKLGHGNANTGTDFDYLYASTTFSQAVNDGQQLDLTWVITLATGSA